MAAAQNSKLLSLCFLENEKLKIPSCLSHNWHKHKKNLDLARSKIGAP